MTSLLIASDHAGFEFKTRIISLLADVSWEDLGPTSNSRTDYPDYAAKLAKKITLTPHSLGVLICGSGIGMSIAANKINGIRASVISDLLMAKLSREHNNLNIICLGSRFIAPEYGAELIRTWINTPFSNDSRHQQRIDKIHTLEGA